MRKYVIMWNEKNNTIEVDPSESNVGGKSYVIKRDSVVTFELISGEHKTMTTIGGCVEYLAKDLDKEDLISLASLLYSWGQYNGARM